MPAEALQYLRPACHRGHADKTHCQHSQTRLTDQTHKPSVTRKRHLLFTGAFLRNAPSASQATRLGRLPPTAEASVLEEALVVAHDEVGLDLAKGVEGDAAFGCPGAELFVSQPALEVLTGATLDYTDRHTPRRFRPSRS